MSDLNEKLRKKIQEALARYEHDGNSSDGFDILRWARRGLLKHKDD